MVMSWIFTGFTVVSLFCAALLGRGSALSAAISQGAENGIRLVCSIAGSLVLWSGVGKLLEAAGVTDFLSRLLRPLLCRVFPRSRQDRQVAGAISGNVCANLLGLGNAATPMGIRAAKGLRDSADPERANDQLCRLVVLNTASIQLIPGTVAALRGNLGSHSPFDILPAVWLTSLCSAGMGLAAAWVMGRLWRT